MATYTYSISQDFPNAKVDPSRLASEIGRSAIVTALASVNTAGNDCNVVFKASLSSGDEAILDGLVAAHSGEPLEQEVPPISVKILDVEDLDPVKARSKVKGVNFDAPAGEWTKYPVSFPYRTNVLCGKGFGGFCEDGDKVEFAIDPQAIGAVAVAASEDDTEFYLYAPDPSVWDVLLDGMWIQFCRSPGSPLVPDSEHPGDDEYEIASFDKVTGKITLCTGLESDVPQGAVVFLVVKYGETIELQKNELIDVGSDSSGAAPLPENMIFNTWYYNAGASQKRVRLRLSLKYGPLKTKV